VNRLNFYIFPVLNPDGFIFSRTSKKDLIRQWRKNRAPTNCSGFGAFKKKRIPGLNRGTISMSEDFDEPLPDDFWLGRE